MNNSTVAKGLAGVVVDETKICQIDKDENLLYYYGYEIKSLTDQAAYEEVAYLLAHGDLPSASSLASYKTAMAGGRALPDALKAILERLPADADPMDVLRTGCSVLGSLEPESSDNDQFKIGAKLANYFCSMLFYWHRFHRSGERIETETGEDSVAGHFLHLLSGKTPDEAFRRAMDVSLIIYAEHDFNASTYAARIAASTLSDVYSCYTSAIGTLRGPWHGGANAAVMKMLEQYKTPDEAEAAVLDMFANKKRVIGFGQRVYATADPRNAINKVWAEKLTEAAGDTVLYPVAERIEEVVWREKKIFANLDYYTAVIYRMCGLPTHMFPAVFVIARTSGLLAHIAEQRANNKLIHPLAKFIGPAPRPFVSLERRD
ncbi:MAG: citrate/2-methylcitrate synthase [Rhodospirillales bacterium]